MQAQIFSHSTSEAIRQDNNMKLQRSEKVFQEIEKSMIAIIIVFHFLFPRRLRGGYNKSAARDILHKLANIKDEVVNFTKDRQAVISSQLDDFDHDSVCGHHFSGSFGLRPYMCHGEMAMNPTSCSFQLHVHSGMTMRCIESKIKVLILSHRILIPTFERHFR
jgi:hypothetical protein